MARMKNLRKPSGRITLRITVFDGPPDCAENFRKSFASARQAARYLREELIPKSAAPFLFPVEKQDAINPADLEKALETVALETPECAQNARAVMKIRRDLAEIEKLQDEMRCRAALAAILARWNRRFGRGKTGVRIEEEYRILRQ
jgi:hypothetical protein